MGKFSSTVPNQNKLFAGIERLPRATFRGSEPTIRRAAGSWDHHQGVFRRGSGWWVRHYWNTIILLHCCCLPRSIVTEEGGDLTLVEVQVQVLDGHLAVGVDLVQVLDGDPQRKMCRLRFALVTCPFHLRNRRVWLRQVQRILFHITKMSSATGSL